MNTDRLSELISRCALADQAALHELYALTAPYLNRVAFNILRSEALSNEALQDAFVEIWKNAGKYRADIAAPLTWLCSITRYRALDKLAQEKKHNLGRDTSMETDQLKTHVKGVADLIADADEVTRLGACIDTLSGSARQCVKMAYLEGYSREELAIHFEQNVNTIKSWLHRSVKRLRLCLDQQRVH